MRSVHGDEYVALEGDYADYAVHFDYAFAGVVHWD